MRQNPPEQALAVVELLDDLRDCILRHYQLPIMELMHEERGIDPFDDLDATDVARDNEQLFLHPLVTTKRGLNEPLFVDQNTRSFSVVDVRQFSAFLYSR